MRCVRSPLPSTATDMSSAIAPSLPGFVWSAASLCLAIAANGPLATAIAAQSTQTSAARDPGAYDPLNLDFERAGLIAADRPLAWYVGGNGYRLTLDADSRFSGARSLRSERLTAGATALAPNAFGVASIALPGGALAGKTVKLRGFIRSQEISRGYAGLWLRVDGPANRTLFLDNMSARGVSGTTGWTPYEITVRVDSAAVGVMFGVLHPGDGTAWFDALSIDVDGKPFVNEVSSARQASAAEVEWLRKNASKLVTSDPRARFDDLRPIGNIVGDARIVALGEGTHGTSEFFRMKHRITNYLAQEKGFTVFAIEANMPEARRVNEYVLTGRGDPRAALSGMYFWTWDTQEVLDMIEWMRAYNASGKGRMEFWGFDLQTPTVAMDSVRAFVRRSDPAYAAALDSAYSQIDTVVSAQRAGVRDPAAVAKWERAALGALRHVESSRARYVADGRDTLDIAWAIQNARIVAQAAGSTRGTLSRDSSMAANVEWIAAHQPVGTRMVLWAHNGHVNRSAGWMGAHLHQRFGNTMRVFGFGLGEGDYTAHGPRGLNRYPATPPPPGSIESAFRATGLSQFVLDLRGVAKQPLAAWLDTPRDFRSIGSMAMDGGFFPVRLPSLYDAVIYFDRTTPSAAFSSRNGR